ncbi:hypothetical protein A1Q1_03286 [Trichosporon asahii var. asahii CBS 2479]|uniref:N-acetyltransferase domain-containing protein n=1 Tax=Trichosporon asahii var. asahii (strain ATCC 90039 / CBS 2479 / JCM 2466 / KCTC 7840 / NBRC 103889/ NCYC 2677 / UAMH 7654) TaxID=1186058 RepID=J4UAM2_TRIAS|nr:hypothetical protein A1Q1_03286 [Trichosporon asahii var. asahii CBS 2479]EJT47825.1 hypothetical protein A1Q1_03286 [Trichosporon asahii var. asahii CBS 2479]
MSDEPDRVPLDQLTIVRCDAEQIKQTLRNHWPKWGQPRGFPIDTYLARGERLRADQSFSKDDAHVTWGLVDRKNPSVLLSHCETFRRPALILPPGEKKPQDATTYTMGAVFCPEINRGKGYGRHMLRLMHYVVGDPKGLPPFPKAWGEPPAERLGDARFSVLYSEIGNKFYSSCRVGDGPDSTEGWVEQRQDTRTWYLQPGGPIENNGLWEWLGRKDSIKLEHELSERFRQDLPNQGDPKKTRVAVLPTSVIDYHIFRFMEMFPDHPSPKFGCILPPDENGRRPFFIYSAVGKHPDAPHTLEIMHAQQPVPWAAVRAAAVHHGVEKVKLWGGYTGWDKEEGGVKVEQNEDCPSLANYGLGEVDWQFNDQ